MGDEMKLIIQFVIPAIIGSSVFTAIVNQLFVSVSNKKSDSLENITKERDLWRKQLRSISLNISNLKEFEKEKILLALDEIALIINPFGRGSWDEWNVNCSEWVKTDGYLWQVIDKIRYEIDKNGRDEYTKGKWETDKNELVYRVSILLKLDWERSKREIIGNRVRKISFFTVLLIQILTLFFAKDLILKIADITIDQSYPAILIIFTFFVIPLFIRFYLFEMNMKPSSIIFIIIGVPFIMLFLNLQIKSLNEFKNVYINWGYIVLLIIVNLISMIFIAVEIGTTYGKVTAYFENLKKNEKEQNPNTEKIEERINEDSLVDVFKLLIKLLKDSVIKFVGKIKSVLLILLSLAEISRILFFQINKIDKIVIIFLLIYWIIKYKKR